MLKMLLILSLLENYELLYLFLRSSRGNVKLQSNKFCFVLVLLVSGTVLTSREIKLVNHLEVELKFCMGLIEVF